MFTGLVQKVGTLSSMQRTKDGWRLTVSYSPWDDPLELGESVAVQGACLTVTSISDTSFSCDVLAETMNRTALSRNKKGSRLNLERALRAGDRLGGHFVSGHVDGTGTVLSVAQRNNDRVLSIGCDQSLLADMVEKGSITIDGVSLTISGLKRDLFEVCLIPFTWAHTSLGSLSESAPVNLETDILAKHVRRMLSEFKRPGEVGLDDLQNAGFC